VYNTGLKFSTICEKMSEKPLAAKGDFFYSHCISRDVYYSLSGASHRVLA